MLLLFLHHGTSRHGRHEVIWIEAGTLLALLFFLSLVCFQVLLLEYVFQIITSLLFLWCLFLRLLLFFGFRGSCSPFGGLLFFWWGVGDVVQGWCLRLG